MCCCWFLESVCELFFVSVVMKYDTIDKNKTELNKRFVKIDFDLRTFVFQTHLSLQ